MKHRSMDEPTTARRRRGFTLVEVMITVAILAVLIAAAVPSFEFIRNTSSLASASNDVLAAVQTARTEAVRRGVPVVLCRSEDGATCNAGGGNWGGWLVFADIDRSGAVSAGDDLIQSGTFPTRMEVRAGGDVATGNQRVVFRPSGMAPGPGGAALLDGFVQVCLPTTRPEENVRRVAIGAGGRVSVASQVGGGACP
ncbi:MAG: GspH/FimT family pseudopilin [Lysobacteraceae bacterium]